jgi:hypothetical protein
MRNTHRNAGSRNHWWLCLALLSILGVGNFAILLTAPSRRSGITKENFDRIRDGMTEAEVEEILGGPPGTYTDRLVVVPMEGTSFRRWWVGHEGVITILVTPDEPPTVCDKKFDTIPPESLSELFRRRCPWLP